MNACPNKFILILLVAACSSCSKPDAKKLFNAGDSKYASGDFAGAIAEFDMAIQIDPNYVKAYNNRGMAKDALHQSH
jgi:tetratricopeptide (TPR) repeat protein